MRVEALPSVKVHFVKIRDSENLTKLTVGIKATIFNLADEAIINDYLYC